MEREAELRSLAVVWPTGAWPRITPPMNPSRPSSAPRSVSLMSGVKRVHQSWATDRHPWIRSALANRREPGQISPAISAPDPTLTLKTHNGRGGGQVARRFLGVELVQAFADIAATKLGSTLTYNPAQ